jgi:hypothetical protein
MNEETFKPTLSKPTVQGTMFQNNAKKINNKAGLKLNETDSLLSEAEQSLKKKIFSLNKMEALVFSDPKLSAVYEEMAENGEERFGYHYNETIMNMLFNDYVLNSPKYLQKYKQAIPKEKTRRDQSGINQLKKAGEKTMQHKTDIQKPEKLAPTGLKPAVAESDEPLTKVEFLVNERDPKNPDLFAYFPEENYDNAGKFKTAYSHVGQHSSASPEYAKESRPATPEEYADLKAELESIGYNLNVLNSADNTIGESGEMLAQYAQNAFNNRQGSTPINFIINYLKSKYEISREKIKILMDNMDKINTFYNMNPNPDKLKNYADKIYQEIGNETNETTGAGSSGAFSAPLGIVRRDVYETTGTGGGSGLSGGQGASGNGESGTGPYYTPNAWGKGDLIHPKGEAPVKRIPAWKGGKIIQESNYLIETEGFEKYIQALNEDEDINNKLGQVYQATHSKSNKGLGVSELPQSPERNDKIREIEDNTMLFLGQDLQHSPDGDVEIFHKDMTEPHTLIPHPDNKIPQMQTDGIVQSTPRTPVGVWDKIKAGNGKQTPEITNIEKKSDDGYGDLGNMTNADLNIINTDINTEKLDNPNLRPMEESKEIKEVAKSKSQQQLFGMAHAVQKGELSPSKVGGAVKKIAKDVSPEDVEDFASTKHKGLPEKVKKVDETEESIIGDKQNSMSNKSVPTNTPGGNVPMGTQNTGGGSAMNESDIKLLEELDNELKAYSIHHKKLMKMSEDKKPSSLILKDRLGDENKANFKKDLQHSGTKEIIDVEKELQWKDQQTEVGKDPQKLGAEIEDTEIKATDAKSGEALKNVGNSTNEKGDEIPKRNLTTEEQDEVNKYKLNLKDYVYDNKPDQKFEDRMKKDMGEKNYKQRQTNLEFRGKAPMYNKDPQPTDQTTADKVQFDKEQTGWNERVGLKESMVTGRYLDALNKRRLIDFALNEVKIISTDKLDESLFELDFTGLGNTYNSKTINKKVVVNEEVINVMNENKFFTDGKQVFAMKNPVQILNENEQKGKKSPINEQVEKMKHLTGYNTKNYIDTKGIKL